MALSHMYRDGDNEPAYMAEQIAEHNRLVRFYEGEEGREIAQTAYEYWRDKFERTPTEHANRMRDVAGGLAGLFEPWMTKVGYLTVTDAHYIHAFDMAEEPQDKYPRYDTPEVDEMNRGLSTRQQWDAAELSMEQELKTHGDPTPSQQEQFLKQREELDAKSAEERARYNAEYHDANPIDKEQLPPQEEGRERLTGREEEGSYQRTLSTMQIYDLTYIADDAQAFKRGLEEEGMILAREGTGKFLRILVVDRSGKQYDLARIVTRRRAPEFNKMMASLDPLSLPTVEAAKGLIDTELDALLKNLSARQAKEEIDLARRQENQIHGDAPNWLLDRHQQERDAQDLRFADERERYIAEHNEAKHILEEMRQDEKQEALERGDHPEEEPRKFSR